MITICNKRPKGCHTFHMKDSKRQDFSLACNTTVSLETASCKNSIIDRQLLVKFNLISARKL